MQTVAFFQTLILSLFVIREMLSILSLINHVPLLSKKNAIFRFWERVGLVVNASDSGSRGRGFELHSGQTVLCPGARRIYPPPQKKKKKKKKKKSTFNTQEAMAPSQHD